MIRSQQLSGLVSGRDRSPVKPSVALGVCGPILPAVLTSRANDTAEKMRIEGYVLIDTGAATTAFDKQSANDIGLPTVGKASLTSASEVEVEVSCYSGQIEIQGLATFEFEKAWGVDISEHIGPQTEDDSPDIHVIAVIGRDLLSNCFFVYDGIQGSVTLSPFTDQSHYYIEA